MRAFPPEELRLWFRRRGVPTSPVDGFHCFPDSQRAGDLLDALLREAAQYGVRIFCNTAVDGLLISDGKIAGCRAGKREFRTGKLIIAGGGNGYPALGARGLGYQLAESVGHTVLTPVPALVGLRTKEEWPTRLAGITVERARAGFGRGRTCDGVLLFTKNRRLRSGGARSCRRSQPPAAHRPGSLSHASLRRGTIHGVLARRTGTAATGRRQEKRSKWCSPNRSHAASPKHSPTSPVAPDAASPDSPPPDGTA
ncbi:MAG: NAD(P)/FAD-dependent oxidoreductase [Lentisphaeria bacterium]|nr:MAG: NAD(P)/FAD-dependent oxidoreductase [Lentisphaeria bacterium]